MWKVNAGRRSVFASEFLSRNIVAIGWPEAGDYVGVRSKDELTRLVRAGYPDRTDRQTEVSVNQIWRFLRNVRPGDSVLTYDPGTRLYHLGRIDGEPRYRPDDIPSLPVQRAVTWNTSVSRDDLSTRAKGKLGSILTLFLVEEQTVRELESIASGNPVVDTKPDAAEGEDEEDVEASVDPLDNLQEQAIERIKDRLLSLDWDEMQEMVASLLRALGYRTLVSPAGPDRARARTGEAR